MTTIPHIYTVIVPRLDHTGPVNVAMDLGHAAIRAGWQVNVLYLSGGPQREDIVGFSEARRFRLADIFRLRGVVHTHCLRPDLLGALMRFNRHLTLVTTLHNYFRIDLGFDHANWKVCIAWSLWRRALQRFDHRVSISHAMQRYYSRLLPQQRFETVYNFCSERSIGVKYPPRGFENWLQAQREASRKVLVYVGALNSRKNVAALLQALSGRPSVGLVVCGQGPLTEVLRDQAAVSELAERVLFLGQVRSPEAVVSRCDVLVLPSRAEGMPLVALEAARLGRPCLLSNIAVHRELASLGLGVTFDHRSFINFDERLQALMNGSSANSEARLRSLWETHFTADRGFESYRQLWEAGDVRAPTRKDGA